MNLNAMMVSSVVMGAKVFGAVILFFFGLITGYWMGRNSAERPFIQKTVAPKKSQGPTTEPEHGDIFKEALTEPDTDDADRIPTMDRRLS